MLSRETRKLVVSIPHIHGYNLRRFFVNESRTTCHPTQKKNLFHENVLDFFYKKLDEKVNNGPNRNRNKIVEKPESNKYKATPLENVNFYKQILRALHKLALNQFGYIVKIQLYKEAMKILRKGLLRNELTLHESLQYLFYSSLAKKQSIYQVEEVINSLPDLKKLSLFEKCILAESCAKAGKKLNAEQVKELETTLIENSEYLVANPRLLVCLSKIIRYSGPSKDIDLNKLSTQIICKKQAISVPSASYILQLYAQAYIDDKKVIEYLFSEVLRNIRIFNTLKMGQKYDDLTLDLYKKMKRAKYLNNILWAVSRLSYQVSLDDFKEISTYIDKIYDILIHHNLELVGILVHLWSLGYPLEEKIKECLQTKIFHNILHKGRWKLQMRIHLLLTCISIEAKHIDIPNELMQIKHPNIYTSDNVMIVYKIIQMLSTQLKLSDVCVASPIPGICTNGVSFIHPVKGKVHIDVLDDSNQLKFSLKPDGILSLKLRLLPKVGYYSLLVDKQYMSDHVSAFAYIENTISKFLNAES